jgi:hypothetical protein
MRDQLSLQIAEDGADPERIDTLTGHLRRELLQLDVEDVTLARGGPAPDGARAIDLAMIGGLIVSLGSSAASLKDIVTVVRKWLTRGDGVRRTIKIDIDGDSLELSEVSVAEQDRLIEMFIQRHAGGEDGRWPASAKP